MDGPNLFPLPHRLQLPLAGCSGAILNPRVTTKASLIGRWTIPGFLVFHYLGVGLNPGVSLSRNQKHCLGAVQKRGPWTSPTTTPCLRLDSSTQTLSGIYGSRLATVAAINGACPAGGCVLAMCCAPWTGGGAMGWAMGPTMGHGMGGHGMKKKITWGHFRDHLETYPVRKWVVAIYIMHYI